MQKISVFFHRKARLDLLKDLLLIGVGIVFALILSKLGFIDSAVSAFGNVYLASFIAGLFFTSVFTVSPASIALAHIAFAAASPWPVILYGALGALFGDLIIFFFIRDRFADDIINSVKPSIRKHILSSFHLGFMKWLSPLVGALIIASPLPDEFGVALLGISKTRMAWFIPISFVMNAVGVYGVIWFAQIF
jgi:hypothetical protein